EEPVSEGRRPPSSSTFSDDVRGLDRALPRRHEESERWGHELLRGGPRLTDEEARLIQEVIHEYCGLSYGLDSFFFLERRLGPRLDALGLGSYLEYYHY